MKQSTDVTNMWKAGRLPADIRSQISRKKICYQDTQKNNFLVDFPKVLSAIGARNDAVEHEHKKPVTHLQKRFSLNLQLHNVSSGPS